LRHSFATPRVFMEQRCLIGKASLYAFLTILVSTITGVPAARAAEEAPIAFDIPAQPLANALNAWAVQANAQVFFEQAPVAGLNAPAGTCPQRMPCMLCSRAAIWNSFRTRRAPS
jgi:hypothetical protein